MYAAISACALAQIRFWFSTSAMAELCIAMGLVNAELVDFVVGASAVVALGQAVARVFCALGGEAAHDVGAARRAA